MAIRAALAVRPGRVAVPAYSCYDVSTAAEGAGARVLLYDVDPTTLSPNPESLARAVERGATAAVAVHLFGVPVDILGLRDKCGPVVMIEDAAQGVGARYGGAALGAFGDLGVMSFARGKGMAGGGGGALLATSDTGEDALGLVEEPGPGPRGWKSLAQAAALWLLGRPPLYGAVASLRFLRLGETIYREPHPTSGISRATLGILGKTLALSEEESVVRKRNAAELVERIEESSGALTLVRPPLVAEPGYLRLPVITRAALGEGGLGDIGHLGVARGYPTPLGALPSCRQICDNADDAFPGAEYLADRLITLPVHGRLTARDWAALLRWIDAQARPH